MPNENKEKENSRLPGPHHKKTGEKAKNFKVAIKKLSLDLKKYWVGIIIAFILAGAGAILTIMAPDRLSNLTDELTKGLVPKIEKLMDLTHQISQNLQESDLNSLITEILALDFSEQNIGKVLASKDYTDAEKQELREFLKNIQQDDALIIFSNLSPEIKRAFLKNTEYHNIYVSVEDKLSLLQNMTNIKNDAGFPSCMLPVSIIKIIFPTFSYEGKEISSLDQATLIDAFNKIENKEDGESLYKTLDELPESIYEIIKPTLDFSKIKSIVLLIAILYGLNSLFGFLEGLIMVDVTNNYSRGLRNNIARKINRLPLSYFDKTTIGDVLSRVTNDVDMISQSMNQSLTTFVSAICLFVGSLIMMFYTNVYMAITAVVSSLLGFVFMFGILGKSQKYFLARQTELGNINGHIEEVFSGHNVVTLYNGKKEVDKKFDELNEKVYISERKSQFLSGLMHPFMSFIGNFGYVCVCIVGAILTMNGNISFGIIVAFMMYIRLFTNPLTQIAQSMTSLQSTAAASERVFEFLEQKEMANEVSKTKHLDRKSVKGEIEFSHVQFGYDEDKMIIKDFSAHALPGQKIAIVGPTGAGKTTLVNLLMRFYELNSGDIKIDGVSTKDLTRDNIHKLFIMVLQDTWLFNGTIRDNIRYNKENVTDEDIWKVCDVVGVSHYIKTLPKGLDSEINDAGSISSGQKQLLTIARGMIEDAPFLILDEATSNVDTRTEELVQKAMDKLMEGRTSFIIAHRLSTIKNADLILVMNEGNIIESGNHEKLMKQNGFYANLYNSQFEKFNK